MWLQVLDDNKKLCLNSGEIIAMQGLMNMIFEVQDLAVASPATVSRCGMVYMQPQLLGWRPVFQSWLATLPAAFGESHRAQVTALCDWLLPPLLRAAQKELPAVLPMQEINLAVAWMQLFESLLAEWRDTPQVWERLAQPIGKMPLRRCVVLLVHAWCTVRSNAHQILQGHASCPLVR